MAKPNQSHHVLLQRITQLKNDCLAIIKDEKPVVPRPLFEQLARMHTGFFMTDLPQAYTTLGHEASHLKAMTKKERAEYIRTTKGLFPAQTMTRALVLETEQISKKLKARHLTNFRVMGSETTVRQSLHTTPEYEEADMFILPKGDIFGLYEFTQAVERRLKGEDPHPHKPLIAQNHEGFWDPILNGLLLTKENVRWFESHNIFMTNRLSRVEAICANANIDKEKQIPPVKAALEIKPGATILVATRQNRKIHELQKIFDALGANIRVLPFHVVVGRPREAEEISGTYIGNNIEKMQAVQEKIANMPRAELEKRLRRHGLSLDDNTFVLCDDRGIEFETNFFAEPEFAELRKHLNPNKRGLGVEMANFLRAIANAGDMYNLIEKSHERMTAEGRKPSRDAYDYACYAVASITDLAHPLVVTATTEDEIVAHPEYDTKIGYSEDYLKLKRSPYHSKNMTPNFMAHHSAMALAVATMAKITGLDAARDVKLDVPELFKDYAQTAYDNRQERWKIGMPQSSSLEGSMGTRSAAMRILNQGFKREFALVAGHKDYDLGAEHSFTVMGEDGTKMPWYSSLVSADKFAKEVDAFYFRPIGPAANMMEEFARDFSFFTPIVGKQTFGPHYHPKPNVVDVRYAKRQLANYDYLHMLGLIGDAPVYLMDAVDSKSEAQRVLSRKLKNYVRPDDVDVPLSVEGSVPDGLFRIVVYASASNRGEAINRDAFRLGELSAEKGFSAINGGGNDGLMKSYADGVVHFRKMEKAASPSHIVVNGLTSIQCIDTIESEGEYPHADLKERHPTIFHRMDKLQENDAEIFLAGGAGTLQEFYATCMARLRTGRIENRPLILVNQDIRNGDDIYKVWDKLIASLPAGAAAACNIHIVNTVDEAMDICVEARAKRGMTPIMKVNPYLTANENKFNPAQEQPKVA